MGGTVGGVAGLLLAGLAVFFYARSRRDRAHLKDTVAEFEEHKVASTIQPFTLGAGAGATKPWGSGSGSAYPGEMLRSLRYGLPDDELSAGGVARSSSEPASYSTCGRARRGGQG